MSDLIDLDIEENILHKIKKMNRCTQLRVW